MSYKVVPGASRLIFKDVIVDNYFAVVEEYQEMRTTHLILAGTKETKLTTCYHVAARCDDERTATFIMRLVNKHQRRVKRITK